MFSKYLARYILFPCFLLIFVFMNFAYSAEVSLSGTDRILILAPHPDDEVLGCAGIIQEAVSKNIPLKIVFFTYGDNNEWSFLLYNWHPVLKPSAVRAMGNLRHDEALSADTFLGIPKDDIIFLGYPDYGTLNIWYSRWRDNAPFKSMLTKTTKVPYKTAFRPGSLYKGEEILKDIKTILSNFKPTKIFLSHPADYNRDHISLYLFTRVALWDLEKEISPDIYPYLVHYPRWPEVKGSHPDLKIIPPTQLKSMISWQEIVLSPNFISRKKYAIKKHASQYNASKKFLLSFERKNEIFGDFPVILKDPDSEQSFLCPKITAWNTEIPRGLHAKIKKHYVDIEWKFIRIKDNQLILSAVLSQPISNNISANIRIFGYRKDVPFPEMPKISAEISEFGYLVLDNRKRIFSDKLKIDRKPKTITFIVSLDLLNNPDRILLNARTGIGHIPLDNIPWRVIDLSKT